MKLNDIDNIIFDLGGVILNLDYNKTVIEFKKKISKLDPSVFYGKENQLDFFSQYEVGQISTPDFLKEFNSYYNQSYSLESFSHSWNAMILDLPKSRLDLIKSLRDSNKKVYLLSNINELHEVEVQKRYKDLGLKGNFFDLFDKAYLSHKVGLRKPTQEIFKHLIDQENLDINKTLFIDDSLHHIKSANALGIEVIHINKTRSLESFILF